MSEAETVGCKRGDIFRSVCGFDGLATLEVEAHFNLSVVFAVERESVRLTSMLHRDAAAEFCEFITQQKRESFPVPASEFPDAVSPTRDSVLIARNGADFLIGIAMVPRIPISVGISERRAQLLAAFIRRACGVST